MLDVISKTADKLAAYGIAEGDRVAILSENSREFAIAIVALWKLRAVAAPVSTRLPKASLNELLDNINANHILDSKRLKEIVTCDTSLLKFPEFDSLGLDLADDASILFTSASSGMPKAVLHTIGNHYYSALGSHENIPFAADDCWLMSLPMYHISGFSLIMRAIVGNASIYFSDQPLDKAITQNEITHISLVPTQLQRLINAGESENLQRLKSILLGGTAIPHSLIEKAKELNLPLHTTYGSTELASQIATDSKVLPHRELTIAAGGEILVKGRTLFKGYVNDVAAAIDENGYFATGDIGRFDENGNLQITGRKDLMFISGGENIYPEQIERALCDIDNIEQAAVVPIDDPEFGQRPVAFIQTCDKTEPDCEKIKAFLREKLESFKFPVKFYQMPDWESKSLKPNRQKLRTIAENPELG